MIKRFDAIEGLRGYLAWMVVADHVVSWTGTGGPLGLFGGTAVKCFVIVSGYVITHLLVAKPEPYRYYILRRWMRLFPLFAVTCIGGYFAYRSQLAVFGHGYDPATMAELQPIIESQEDHFWGHVAAHSIMLHGLVPYNWLPHGDMTFSMFAWTISLECQFYTVAPVIVATLLPRSLGFTVRS